jgi:hypothetical protein
MTIPVVFLRGCGIECGTLVKHRKSTAAVVLKVWGYAAFALLIAKVLGLGLSLWAIVLICALGYFLTIVSAIGIVLRESHNRQTLYHRLEGPTPISTPVRERQPQEGYAVRSVPSRNRAAG